MNGRKLIETIFLVLSLAGILWLVTTVTTLPGFFQVVMLATLVVVATIYFVYPTLPFDYKFLTLLLLGCALFGKGFSYVSPFEPVYIAEVTIVVCLGGLVFRWMRPHGFVLTVGHGVIFLWMAVVGFYLFDGFSKFGMLAIRDSAIGYYGLYFFFAFGMFQRERVLKAFGMASKWMVAFGCIGAGFVLIMAHFGPVSLRFMRFANPHPDTFLPLIVAFSATAFVVGAARKQPVFFLLGILGAFLLLSNKTAGLFSFGCVMLCLVVFAKRVELLFAGVATGFVAVLLAAILISAESKFFKEVILASDQVQTVIEVGDAGRAHSSGNDSTSDWRITWWKIVIADTMKESPMFGMGLGADISGHFAESVLGITDISDYARYPHSVLFTVFGRMGFVGLAVFLVYLGFIVVFSARFARRYFVGSDIDTSALIAFSIFIGGLANGLVQATYEAPYAAVQHWVCLAYLIAYDRRYRTRPRVVREAAAPAEVVVGRRERQRRIQQPGDGKRPVPLWTPGDCANNRAAPSTSLANRTAI